MPRPTRDTSPAGSGVSSGVGQFPIWLRAAHFGYGANLRFLGGMLVLMLAFFGGLAIAGAVQAARPDAEPGAGAMVVVFGALALVTLYLGAANVVMLRRGGYRPPPGMEPGTTPLQRAFHYNERDLVGCRNGLLSEHLRARLMDGAAVLRVGGGLLAVLLLAFVGVMGFGLARQVFLLARQVGLPMPAGMLGDETFVLWQMIVFGAALGMGGWVLVALGRTVRHKLEAIQQDLAGGRVAVRRGVVTRHRLRGGKYTTYYVQVGDLKSAVTYQQWRSLKHGQIYTLYTAPASGIILAVEG